MNKTFWKDLIKALNIFGYSELAKKSKKEMFGYIMILYTIAFVVALLIAIPAFISFPRMLQSELAKSDVFQIDVDFNSSKSLNFPQSNPFLTISNEEVSRSAAVSITKKELVLNFFPGISKSYDIDTFKDIKQNRGEISSISIPIIVFLIPSIIFIAYGFNLLKYFLIALVMSLIVKVFMSIFRRKIKYKKLFVTGFYSLTPLILIEMILIPLNIPGFYIPLVLYIIWYIVTSIELVEDF